jgi:Holliday junction DNA helicase RuvA
MMCSAGIDDLINAIATGDVATLKRLKGIGPKRAERLVIELKERVAPLAHSVPAAALRPAVPANLADAVLALLALGYPRLQSEQAVGEAAKALKDASTEELVKRALQMV